MNYTDAPDGVELPSNVEVSNLVACRLGQLQRAVALAHELENETKWIKL